LTHIHSDLASRRQENISTVYISSNLLVPNSDNSAKNEYITTQDFPESTAQEIQAKLLVRENITSEQLLGISDSHAYLSPDMVENTSNDDKLCKEQDCQVTDAGKDCEKKEFIGCSFEEENTFAEYFQLLASHDKLPLESKENVPIHVEPVKQDYQISTEIDLQKEYSQVMCQDLASSPKIINERKKIFQESKENTLLTDISIDLHPSHDLIVPDIGTIHHEDVHVETISSADFGTDSTYWPGQEFIQTEDEKYSDESTSDEDSMIVQDHSEIWHNFINSDNNIETVIDFEGVQHSLIEERHEEAENLQDTKYCQEIIDLGVESSTVSETATQELAVTPNEIAQHEEIVFPSSLDFILKSSSDQVNKISYNDNKTQSSHQDPMSSSWTVSEKIEKTMKEWKNIHCEDCMSIESKKDCDKACYHKELEKKNLENVNMQDLGTNEDTDEQNSNPKEKPISIFFYELQQADEEQSLEFDKAKKEKKS